MTESVHYMEIEFILYTVAGALAVILTLSNLGGGRNPPEWGTFLNNS